MMFIPFIGEHIIYITSVLGFVLAISFLFKKDPEIVWNKVRWVVNNSIGGLLTFFVLITFLDYFGYLK